jgi:hypothetical protein
LVEQLMLISVHIPKTAGSSFLAAIEQHYGQKLRADYGDLPINESALRSNVKALLDCLRFGVLGAGENELECIHGHFLPLKYRFLRANSNGLFVAWLRDPVERIFSHYHYWMRSYDPASSGKLHRRVVEEEWSLERFCLGPEMRNLYTRFFWGFPLKRFDFVGITEHYDSELEYFSKFVLGAPIDVHRVNTNPRSSLDLYPQDPKFCEEVRLFHHKDMILYREATLIREQRMNKVPMVKS